MGHQAGCWVQHPPLQLPHHRLAVALVLSLAACRRPCSAAAVLLPAAWPLLLPLLTLKVQPAADPLPVLRVPLVQQQRLQQQLEPPALLAATQAAALLPGSGAKAVSVAAIGTGASLSWEAAR